MQATLDLVAGTQAGIMQVLQPAPPISMPPSIPELFQVFKEEKPEKSFTEFIKMKLTDKDRKLIEKVTRKQIQSVFWKKQRVGAITASIFHNVVRYTRSEEDNYIVKQILGLSAFSGNAATQFGLKNESLARSLYAQHLKKTHTGSSVRECGLLISESNPILRASPDGKAKCSCCGTGLIEIKCPHTAATQMWNGHELANSGKYHVTLDNEGNIKLKTSSPWYTQIQAQLGVSGFPWCDFIMYTKKAPHLSVERIYLNKTIYENQVSKALKFYERFVVPKLSTQ